MDNILNDSGLRPVLGGLWWIVVIPRRVSRGATLCNATDSSEELDTIQEAGMESALLHEDVHDRASQRSCQWLRCLPLSFLCLVWGLLERMLVGTLKK